jgi:hypothetical protein
VLVLVGALTIGVQKYLLVSNPVGNVPSPLAPARVLPPEPHLQVRPWEALPELRAREDKILNSTGKDENGHFHIPIGQAMDAVLKQLPIRPDSPQGITTSGGGGREFSGSLDAMPEAYRGPRIKGEIHRHAQQ